jgi:hypothetical protein
MWRRVAEDALRLAVTGHVELLRTKALEALEHILRLPSSNEMRGQDITAAAVGTGEADDLHQAISKQVRRRTEHDPVDDREHGRRGPDPECECCDCRGREPRIPPEQPQCEPEVLSQPVDHGLSPNSDQPDL